MDPNPQKSSHGDPKGDPLVNSAIATLLANTQNVCQKSAIETPKLRNSKSVWASAEQGPQVLNWEKVILPFHLEADNPKVL